MHPPPLLTNNMSCLLYVGPLNFLPQPLLSIHTHNLNIYDISLPAHDNYFHHLILVSVFHPYHTKEAPLNGCYFVCAHVFANDIDMGKNDERPTLIFVLQKVGLSNTDQQFIATMLHTQTEFLTCEIT